MKVTTRPLTDAERRLRYRGVSFFSREHRRRARVESEGGLAEELEFEVAEAWNLITCGGPPCCPNTWIVRTLEGEFVYLESWSDLRAADDEFPGRAVVAARFPVTHRLVSVGVRGPAVPAARFDLANDPDVSALAECEVLALEQLPLGLCPDDGAT